MLRTCIAVIVAGLVLSLFVERGARGQHVIAGTVAASQAGEWIAVVNEQTDPGGVRITVRDAVYRSNPGAIRPNVRVTVWYELVGERHPVATKVELIANSAVN